VNSAVARFRLAQMMPIEKQMSLIAIEISQKKVSHTFTTDKPKQKGRERRIEILLIGTMVFHSVLGQFVRHKRAQDCG
jgi:hypothetical protein